jgi:uncharacterized SAM-binding protein YcdF (DUF218 family)
MLRRDDTRNTRFIQACYEGGASIPRGTLEHVNLVPTRWYTPLLMPSTIALLLLAVGLLLVWRHHRRPIRPAARELGWWMAVSGVVLLYLASTPLVATWLADSLERRASIVKIDDLPCADAIVVLGGGEGAFVHTDGSVDLFHRHASDRFERAMRAYRAGKAPLIAFGGGRVPVPEPMNYADWSARLAAERGVPREAILTGPSALYTQDESEGVVALLRTRGVRHVIVCTSAFHVPRTRLIYESLGLQVTPLPADFDTRGEGEEFSWGLLLPRGLALAQTETCVKEWIGILAFRLTGRGG